MASLNRIKFKVFYGWWIVGAGFFIALFTSGGILLSFTALFEPIANEMGWSYTHISLAASLRGLESSLLAPLIGIFADRWGPRRLIFGGSIIIAIGLILLSNTTSLTTYYIAFLIIALGISGCAVTAMMTAISNWFRKKVGTASGIVSAGYAFGGLLIPVIVLLIETYEWRMTVILIALGMLVTIIPLSLLFRHKPEQYGYLPDGQIQKPITSQNSQVQSQAMELNISTGQALKSRTFWGTSFAFMFHIMVVNAIATHVMPYLSSVGITRSVSGLVATAIQFMSIIGRLGLGWLGDRIDRRFIVAGALAMMGIGLFCFARVSSTNAWLLFPFIVLYSVGFGGGMVMRPALVREYFGRTHFGAIFGFLTGITMLGVVIGAPLAGWVYDNWSNYQGIWFAYSAITIVSIMLILTITRLGTEINQAEHA